MIGFTLQNEPATFDQRCRKRGRAWLAEHDDYDRPRDYWSEFEPNLREAFHGLCAYCAMKTMKCDVDHFRPVAVLKDEGNDELAYEWSNFRYGDGLLNRKKWTHIILDPFVVRDGWFEIQLPSLQLLATNAIPQQYRELATFTLKKLGLRDGEVIVRYRSEWFDLYRDRKITLAGLRDVAPLIADAVERDLRDGADWRE